MIASYPPSKDTNQVCAPDAIWIDLLNPDADEERAVEKLTGVDIPTKQEMSGIEVSSRFYSENDALFMTGSILTGFAEGAPEIIPVTFVLTSKRLISVRYADPRPFKSFTEKALKKPENVATSIDAMVGILKAIVARLADILEGIMFDVEQISSRLFRPRKPSKGRIPTAKLQLLLTRIGRSQSELTKVRDAGASLIRLLNFLQHQPLITDGPEHVQEAFRSVNADVAGLADISNYVAHNIGFLHDASLGLISIEQNAVMKIFSVASVVFMPPTLIAGIYGMNFELMPELSWKFGYPYGLGLILFSAILPYLIFRKKGWL